MSTDSLNDNRLGRAVASRRAALGLKRKDLAERARLSYPYISEIENGVKEPSARALRQLAEALDLSVAELAALSESVGTQSVPAVPSAAPVPESVALPAPGPEMRGAGRPRHLEGNLAMLTSSAVRPAGDLGGDVRWIVQQELDRWVATQLPELVRAEVRRVLAELEDEGRP